jgi:hypothetical protein
LVFRVTLKCIIHIWFVVYPFTGCADAICIVCIVA